MATLDRLGYERGLWPLVNHLNDTIQPGQLEVILDPRNLRALAPGDQRRQLEMLLAAKIFYDDHEVKQQQARYAQVAFQERVNKSRVAGGPQEEYASRSGRYNDAREELGSPYAARWIAVHDVVIKDASLTDVGEKTWRMTHKGGPGNRAALDGLRHLAQGLDGLRHLYRDVIGLNSR